MIVCPRRRVATTQVIKITNRSCHDGGVDGSIRLDGEDIRDGFVVESLRCVKRGAIGGRHGCARR